MNPADEVGGMQGEQVRTNGLSYYVRDGKGDGEPVVLLHGAPDHGAMWRHQVKALEDAGYRSICPDLLGYGKSERPADSDRYRYELMASDLVALFRELDLDRGSVHIVAHDFGAALGWALAGTDPEWLRSFCAMSVGHANAFFAQLDLKHIRWQWNLFLNSHPQAIEIFQAGEGALFKAVVASHPDVDEVYERFRDRGAMEAMLEWERTNHLPELMAAAFAGQLDADLAPRIPIPTLGVWPEGDAFVWESQMSESGRFVDAEWRYERLRGVGHWFMLERPEETNELLLSWLEEQGGAAAERPPLP